MSSSCDDYIIQQSRIYYTIHISLSWRLLSVFLWNFLLINKRIIKYEIFPKRKDYWKAVVNIHSRHVKDMLTTSVWINDLISLWLMSFRTKQLLLCKEVVWTDLVQFYTKAKMKNEFFKIHNCTTSLLF